MSLEIANLTTYPKLLRFYRIAEMFTGIDHDFLLHPQRETITYTYPSVNERGNWVSAEIEVDRHMPFGLWISREGIYKELVQDGHQQTCDDFLADISKRYKLK